MGFNQKIVQAERCTGKQCQKSLCAEATPASIILHGLPGMLQMQVYPCPPPCIHFYIEKGREEKREEERERDDAE